MPSLSDLSPISTSIFKTWHYLWFYKIVLDSPLFNFYIFHFRCNRVLTIKKIEKKFTQNFQHNHFWYVGLLFLVFFLGICSTCYCIVLTALQRYNQYTIKYTHVKYKSQRYFSKFIELYNRDAKKFTPAFWQSTAIPTPSPNDHSSMLFLYRHALSQNFV